MSAVRQYVEAGGTLLIDDCGGENAFNLSMLNDLLPRAFPQGRLIALSADHALRQGKLPGMDDLTGPPRAAAIHRHAPRPDAPASSKFSRPEKDTSFIPPSIWSADCWGRGRGASWDSVRIFARRFART